MVPSFTPPRARDRPEEESYQRLGNLNFGQAIKVGLSQIVSLIPGFSRSAAAMAGGLLVGLSHEDAAKFSFLLATPIIGAAAVLKFRNFCCRKTISLLARP